MEKGFRRAVVMGCACVVTSRFTVAELERFKSYLPEALLLTDECGEEIFRIEVEEEVNGGKLMEDHVSYSRAKTPEGRATVTILIDPNEEEKAVVVGETFGAALLLLEQLENEMLSRTEELKEKTAKINGLICLP